MHCSKACGIAARSSASAKGKCSCSKYSAPSGMRPMTVPVGERSTHLSPLRSTRVHAGRLHGVPSGRTQSCQSFSSAANARPISTTSTPKRASTSGSTTASCWITSYTLVGRVGRPRWLRSFA